MYCLGQQHSHLQHCSSNADGDVTRSMRQPCLLGNVSCYNLFKCLHVACGNCSERTCFWSHEWKNINQQNDAHRFAISLYYKALWGTVRNGYRERPTLKMTPPTIVQNFGILEDFCRRKQGFISNWLRILSKSIWRGGKMGRGKWYLDTSDKNCCYMGCIRPRHKRFSSAVSSDT